MNPQTILEALKAKKVNPEEALKALAQNGHFMTKDCYGLVLSTTHLVHELSMREWLVLKPNEDEVTIRVKASAINFPDIMCVKGLYPTMPNYPFVPGFEVSGIVVETGDAVKDIKVGDEVIALAGSQMGGHASHINVPATNVIIKPKDISFEEACSLPVVFGTVYYAFQKANLDFNEHVLIQTATGGCGLAALQLARLKNCVCYGTSSRNEKLEILEKLNINYAINYKESAFDKKIRHLTDGRGVDVVLNMLSGDDIQKGLNCLAPGGRYIEIAVHALKTSPKLDLSGLVQNQSIHSIDLRRLSFEKGFDGKEMLTLLAKLLAAGEIVPIVSRIYPLHQIKEAFEYVGTGKHIGKVVISHTGSTMIDCTERCIALLADQQRHCENKLLSQKKIGSRLVIHPIEESSTKIKNEAIAIIGMSGQFPKAKNIIGLWDNILQGKDCIAEVPLARWSINPKEIDKSFCKWMGVLDDIDKFDPLFFNISPIEAELMDPQQRLFLENSWHCFEDAGYSPASLSGSRCGVFVGCGTGDYGQLKSSDHLNAQGLMGASVSILSARISYFMNLKGPCLAIDTACSSSLVAIATACDSLVLGNSDLALAGGVYVMTGPSMHITTSNAGMLSKDGRCFTFDDRANGFVPSEGVGVILLKKLSDAIRDGDNVYGVIRGWGVNQDGKTNGITAPSVNSQIDLETEVYRRFNIDPQTISLVEAHGTGTKLGDPIEVEALTTSFRSFTDKKNYCALGSVKSNVGHLMTAAGVTGVIKTLLALQQRVLPPSIHFEKLNEHIILEGTPFYVNKSLKPWEMTPGMPRRAAVSAFGFSGTNAHLVLEEYVYPKKPVDLTINISTKYPFIFVLSAKNEEQLKTYAASLKQYVIDNKQLNLTDMAYTLQVGREAMDYRMAFVADSREAISNKLTMFIKDVINPDILVSLVKRSKNNEADHSNDHVKLVWQNGNYESVAALWVKGTNIDWFTLYENKNLQRLSLPTYPFARERYWLPDKANIDIKLDANTLSIQSSNFIHPLLHQNISSFSNQKFTSTFSGKEFFLTDHIVQGNSILPGVAYLEMIRAAITKATGIENDHKGIHLRNIVWINPLVFDNQPIQVHVVLSQQEDKQISFEIHSTSVAKDTDTLHCQGYATLDNLDVAPKLDIESLRQANGQKIYNADQCYDLFHKIGIEYGASFRVIETLYCGSQQVLGKLSLPTLLANTQEQYVLHPGLMDAALQSTIGLLINGDIETNNEFSFKPAIPYALQELQILSSCTPNMWVLVQPSDGVNGRESSGKTQRLDIDVCNEQGEICVRMKGYLAKTPGGETEKISDTFGTLILKPYWKKQPIPLEAVETVYAQHFVILVELGGISKKDVERNLPGVHCLVLQIPETGKYVQPIEQRFITYATAIFETIKQIIKNKPNEKVLLQVVVPINDTLTDKHRGLFSGIFALLQTAQIENPHLVGQLIGIAASQIDTSISMILENSKYRAGAHICYSEGNRWTTDWKEVKRPDAALTIPWKNHCVYLITGGLGGLGIIFATDIAKYCQKATLVLTGRSMLNGEKRAQLKKLETFGSKVIYMQIDVVDEEAVTELVKNIVKANGHLDGIIHCAGVLHDNFILNKTTEEFQSVLAPKIAGLVNLDVASKDLPLDFFVAFSSIAACKGNVGQADYATANAFMDTYIHYRNELVTLEKRHGKSLSINWPFWQAGGMQIEKEIINRMLESRGMIPLLTDTGLTAFYQCLASDDCQMMVLEGSSTELKQFMSPSPVKIKEEQPQPIMIQKGELTEEILNFVKDTLSKVIKISPEKIQLEAPFEKYGIDSIIQLKLINELEKKLGELSKTLLFENNTTQELVNYFMNNHALKFSKIVPIKKDIDKASQYNYGNDKAIFSQNAFKKLDDNDIAIIGVSGRYPLSESLDELWEHLKVGRNCITDVPVERWRDRSFVDNLDKKYLSSTRYKRYGGFLKSIDRFDHLLFGIEKENVLSLSPELRLFLEIVWETFEDAGYSRKALQAAQEEMRSGIGVFVGAMYNQYAWSFPLLEQALLGSNSSDWQIANRISHFFNLTGPSIAVNTACSSSLTAIHLACESLKSKNCLMAIAGGINLTLHPSKYDALNKAGYLDNDNLSKSFGDGKGYIPGEGVGAVLLKPLARAIKDGDTIHAIIKSSIINHSGGRQMYGVPEPKQQSQLISRAIEQSGIDPETISYIESAANGSPLGDPLEVVALKNAFKQYTDKHQYCSLGSVKSNLGHLEAASGMSQLAKVILQLKYKTLVPSINTNPLNPNIKLDSTPFYIQDKISPWVAMKDVKSENDLPRRCMINSFGAGGAYANLIIEEFVETDLDESKSVFTSETSLFIFSAKTKRSLVEYIKKMVYFLENTSILDIRKIAASLQKMDHGLDHRVAILASSKKELLEKIKVLQNEWRTLIEVDIYFSSVSTLDVNPVNLSMVKLAFERNDLQKIAQYWLAGTDIDFKVSRNEYKNNLIILPKYVFDHDVIFRFDVQNDNSQAIDRKNNVEFEDSFYTILLEKVLSDDLSNDNAWQLMHEL